MDLLINEVKKRGLSLIELMIAIVIGSVIMLAITMYFVAEYNFRTEVQERIELAREARIAMNQMRRILRFAVPDSDGNGLPDNIRIQGPQGDGYGNRIIVDEIEAGHLSFIDVPTQVRYRRHVGQDALEYRHRPAGGGWAQAQIAERITFFDVNYDQTDNEITLILTATSEDTNQSITIRTSLTPLGGQ